MPRIAWWRRRIGPVVVVALASGGLVAVGVAQGYPAGALRLLSGQAWLGSAAAGQVSLIDGTTAQVAEKVKVAGPGHVLSVGQIGHDAVVADATAGSVSWVSGALAEASPVDIGPASAVGGTRVLTGEGQAHVLLGSRYAALDAVSGRVLRSVDLGRGLEPATAVVDRAGRAWVLDQAGGLVQPSAGADWVRPGVATADVSRLAAVGDGVAVVDPQKRRVTAYDGGGRPVGTACLPAEVTGPVEAVGTPGGGVLVASDSAKALVVADPSDGSCSRRIGLADGTLRLGLPVVSDGRAFVPDLASGRVFVVNLDTGALVAAPLVLAGGSPALELLDRDGVVFYNDPAGQHAGVVRLDGSTAALDKYDPASPQAGTPASANGPQPEPGAVSGSGAGAGTAGGGPASAGTGTSAGTGSGQGSGPAPSPSGASLPKLRLRTSRQPAVAGQQVALQVTMSDSSRLASAGWEFGDGTGRGSGLGLTHTWTRPGSFTITVQAVTAAGSSVYGYFTMRVVGSAPNQPQPRPDPGPRPGPTVPLPEPPPTQPPAQQTVTLTLRLPAGGQNILDVSPASREGTSRCTGTTCRLTYVAGTAVTVSGMTRSGSVFVGWGGTCPNPSSTASGEQCHLTLDADTTVSPQLRATPMPTIENLTATQYGSQGGPLLQVAVHGTPQNFPAPSRFVWDFGDGTQGSSSTEDILHTYPRFATYTITVSATMPDGYRVSASTSITLTDPTPPQVRVTGGGGFADSSGDGAPGSAALNQSTPLQVVGSDPDSPVQTAIDLIWRVSCTSADQQVKRLPAGASHGVATGGPTLDYTLLPSDFVTCPAEAPILEGGSISVTASASNGNASTTATFHIYLTPPV
ncbi:MAG TPA: PKD domain-containing protein [Kineosporiaceae bacterium]|nr:PKD domain-containing protein [Kineosporiaceae bacterium]